ncbi:bifunctional ADP-dependent NAD(P)H-hydrate dehydratase/NAD(P)H-hydrate epimerase [Lujinxingia litoralis]|uniref:Bifunctional NAD(P)H-hydrate repair enzyme n=1 Tax=Lujinxingia litoralis TaxID=2211119 RepID=A0A328C7K8_9DELT|nr:NAD(P)H-hydrate dehydratase [Lujinxingia litoralis]RAL21618.1 bifunctional ADP-dependent NAD(P)H-hydrate dehydratase/NAD(P)H-hydrate epimerase [Lujinxingia litoralis]
MHLVTPESMREMDRRTVEHVGLPSILLMERAARGALSSLLEHFNPEPGARIGVLCGMGNNGGDGVALATMLHHRGFHPILVLMGTPERFSPEAQSYHRVAESLISDRHQLNGLDAAGVRHVLTSLPPCALWCDALLGTGLDRPVEGRFAAAVRFLNDQPAPVFALDTPSGIDGRTGQVLGVCTHADATATFGFTKIGQILDPAREHSGTLYPIDIGIPESVRDEVGVDAFALDDAWLTGKVPARPPHAHKGAVGKVALIGGRAPTTGALTLAARGALLGGAGLLYMGTDLEGVRRAQNSPELMPRTIFDAEGSLDARALGEVLEKADTLVVGPGLGTDAAARQILHHCLSAAPRPTVLDADALTLLATDPELLQAARDLAARAPLVLTPHPGELARLLNISIEEALSDTVGHARALLEVVPAVVVHKSAATVVAAPAHPPGINRTGNAGMATGGMGDVLSGIIAASLNDHLDAPWTAAAIAVCVHGLAGDRACRRHGMRGTTASTLLDELGAIWRRFE